MDVKTTAYITETSREPKPHKDQDAALIISCDGYTVTSVLCQISCDEYPVTSVAIRLHTV